MPTAPIISYATNAARRKPSVWPSAIIMMCALLLITLGGCFLIGVLVSSLVFTTFSGFTTLGGPSRAVPISSTGIMIQAVLYFLAACAFAGAVVLIRLALKWLGKIVALSNIQRSSS